MPDEPIAAYSWKKNLHQALQSVFACPLTRDTIPGLEVAVAEDTAFDAARGIAQRTPVGGDFAEAFALTGNRAALVLGDVSGKGRAAAACAPAIKYVLRAFLRQDSDPACALAYLNDFLLPIIAREPERQRFVCVAVVVVERATGTAREKARQAACFSNEKQICLAMLQYSQDYDETWVSQSDDGVNVYDGYPLNRTGIAGANGNNYKDRILSYTKNEQVWLCPSDQSNTNHNPALEVQAPNIGYHLSGNVITATGLPLASIVAPANLFFIRESGNGYVWNRAYLRPFSGYCDDAIAYDNTAGNHQVHMNGFNLGFADRHVKWHKSSQMLAISHFPEDDASSPLLAKNAAGPYCTVRPTR